MEICCASTTRALHLSVRALTFVTTMLTLSWATATEQRAARAVRMEKRILTARREYQGYRGADTGGLDGVDVDIQMPRPSF